MSDFYGEFAKYYREIFGVSPQAKKFLKERFLGQTILDVGCASGAYAETFGMEGYKVDAFDLSAEMIRQALLYKKENVNYFKANMLEYKKENAYNAIYCVGSTIAHLSSYNAIKDFIKLTLNNLQAGGKAIIQTLNYQNIYENKIKEIQTLTAKYKNIFLERRYHQEGDFLSFDTTLKVEDISYQNSTMLYPIGQETFLACFKELGIKQYQIYAGFSEQIFQDNDPVMVVVFEK